MSWAVAWDPTKSQLYSWVEKGSEKLSPFTRKVSNPVSRWRRHFGHPQKAGLAKDPGYMRFRSLVSVARGKTHLQYFCLVGSCFLWIYLRLKGDPREAESQPALASQWRGRSDDAYPQLPSNKTFWAVVFMAQAPWWWARGSGDRHNTLSSREPLALVILNYYLHIADWGGGWGLRLRDRLGWPKQPGELVADVEFKLGTSWFVDRSLSHQATPVLKKLKVNLTSLLSETV